ncbi:MAG: DUF3488 domain-containing transglutaminase family protein [Gammaproteobacteria bacterium]|nr:DUF3488 domain-containing transglutaminase family protein [Gammaproteobacteria bacterium]MCP5135593.1 DUF3488 domain-containing transglutaminase family protein [Gammaproteobacteria bacterium]
MAISSHARLLGHPPVRTATLQWLLLTLTLIAAPHASWVPIWITLLFLAIASWRWFAGQRNWNLPNGWIRAASALLGVSAVYAYYGTVFGREPGVSLLLVMVALKLMELKTQRDEWVLLLLGYFLLLTAFLFQQGIGTGVYMLTMAILLTTLLTTISDARRPGLETRHWRMAGLMMLQGLPLMLALFILFPRIDHPLWGMSESAVGARTGLSDSMSPGAFTNLTLSDEVAFRVDFDGDLPPMSKLYWRGPVFWRYDGREWRRGGPSGPRRLDFSKLDHAVDYTVTLEPHDRLWLFALDVPGDVPDSAYFTTDYRLETDRQVKDRRVYRMRSWLDYRIDATPRPEDLKLALSLPDGRHPKARELAAKWRQTYGDDHLGIVNEALKRFRELPYRYTLSPPLLRQDPVDEFLFETQAGFCEHYASSFVVLMRAAGVPARIVTGYQGGIWNKLGGYFMVRQADAHAWAEVWLPKVGWLRVDPTAAVAPQRIERGLGAAIRDEQRALAAMAQADEVGGWRYQVALALDALHTNWGRWVVGYNAKRQRSLLQAWGMDEVSPNQLAQGMVFVVGGLLLFFSALMFLRRSPNTLTPVQKAWLQFTNTLEKAGLTRGPHEGPVNFANRAAQRFPMSETSISAIVSDYVELRYGRQVDDDKRLSRLRRAVRSFRPK